MNALLLGLTLLMTIVIALAVGIFLGYGLIVAILHLLGNRREPLPSTAALVPGPVHGGD